MLVAAGVILLLIALTALYVAAEFAAVGARRSRLRRMAEDGSALAARLLPVLDSPPALDRYIAASQVGITLSSLILGAYARAILAPWATPLLTRWTRLDEHTALEVSAAIFLVVLTVLSVILGELVPKAIALQYPTQAALFTVLPMEWSLRAYAWLIALLNGSALIILRALRLPSTGHRHVHSPEEIALLIAESRDGGLLEPQEQVRLHRALRLGLRNARQLMVPRERLAALDLATAMPDVMRRGRVEPLQSPSGLPQHPRRYRRHPAHERCGAALRRSGSRGSLAALVRPIPRVPDTMPADRLLAFLRERRSHQAIVADRAGRVAGLITLEDVLGELLGNVADELKGQRLLPLRLTDGRVRLPGAFPLDRARVWIDGAWPQDGGTVGEFVLHEAGRLPEPGEELTVRGLAVEIEAVENDQIASLIVSPPQEVEA